jgi:hypothetical protein
LSVKDEDISEIRTFTDNTFVNAREITFETFARVLRRIGDKNVLPCAHILLAFLFCLASREHLCDLIVNAPWTELVAFFNAMLKTESESQCCSQTPALNIDVQLASTIFPKDEESDAELPLPEDYLSRGLVWAHDYFPKKWFERERDEVERNLEIASTGKDRIKKMVKVGRSIAEASTIRLILYNLSNPHLVRTLGHRHSKQSSSIVAIISSVEIALASLQ